MTSFGWIRHDFHWRKKFSPSVEPLVLAYAVDIFPGGKKKLKQHIFPR